MVLHVFIDEKGSLKHYVVKSLRWYCPEDTLHIELGEEVKKKTGESDAEK